MSYSYCYPESRTHHYHMCHLLYTVAPVLMDATATSTTIAFSWTQSGSSVDNYTVSYTYTIRQCGLGPMSKIEEISDGNARSFNLNDLEEDSDYTITLTAINSAGQLTSNQISTTTKSAGLSKLSGDIVYTHFIIMCINSKWFSCICQLWHCKLD